MSAASCSRQVTRCNLGLQLGSDIKNSLQSLQKLEQNSTLCFHCKPTKCNTDCREDTSQQKAHGSQWLGYKISNLLISPIQTNATS